MERLGMRQEAHLVQNEFFKGEWADELTYAILGTRWRELREERGPARSCGADCPDHRVGYAVAQPLRVGPSDPPTQEVRPPMTATSTRALSPLHPTR